MAARVAAPARCARLSDRAPADRARCQLRPAHRLERSNRRARSHVWSAARAARAAWTSRQTSEGCVTAAGKDRSSRSFRARGSGLRRRAMSWHEQSTRSVTSERTGPSGRSGAVADRASVDQRRPGALDAQSQRSGTPTSLRRSKRESPCLRGVSGLGDGRRTVGCFRRPADFLRDKLVELRRIRRLALEASARMTR